MVLKSVALALGLVVGASAAHASLVDFTDPASYTINPSNTATGTAGTVAWALVGNGALNNNEVGPGAVGPLTGIKDGIGIGDDEISTATFTQEVATLSFAQSVKVTGLYFLDLFFSDQTPTTYEVASVSVDGGPAIQFSAMNPYSEGVGFAGFESLNLIGTSFAFTAMFSNDQQGRADFALAGVNIAPVPLPAGILLLGGALAGLGLMRRRRRATV